MIIQLTDELLVTKVNTIKRPNGQPGILDIDTVKRSEVLHHGASRSLVMKRILYAVAIHWLLHQVPLMQPDHLVG